MHLYALILAKQRQLDFDDVWPTVGSIEALSPFSYPCDTSPSPGHDYDERVVV